MNSHTVAGVADPGRRSQWLQTTLLRSVSRSFYLSIRFLPALLREPIALAYLLARTSDTVADTSQIPVTVRIETLKLLSDAIQGAASRDIVADLTASIVQCLTRCRLRSSNWQMLLSRIRIKRRASDAVANPRRTGALPADISNLA